MSASGLFFDEVVSDARVLDRPRWRGAPEDGGLSGDGSDGRENAGLEGERYVELSEFKD